MEGHSVNRFRLIRGELIGPPDCPLMRRWAIETPIGSVRVHHFLRSDNERHPHDHPWWFTTLVLAGSYTDVTPCKQCDGEGVMPGYWPGDERCSRCGGTGEQHDVLRRGSFRYRPALHRHWVKTDGAWTFIVTGRKLRRWGFWEGARRFMVERDYFREHGYAACQDVGQRSDRERMAS